MRVTMPGASGKFVRENPLTIFLAAAGILAWVAYTTNLQVGRMERRKPGHALERFKTVPSEQVLNKEKRLIKREIRRPSRQNKRDEEGIASELRRVQELVEKEGINNKNRGRVVESIDRAAKAEPVNPPTLEPVVSGR